MSGKNRIKKIIFIALSITLCFSAFIFAQDKEVIKVGFYNCPNFTEQYSEGDLCGYNADYLDKIAEYTGWQYEYINGERDELLEMLSNNEIDILCACQESTLGYDNLDYSLPVFNTYTKIISRSNDSRYDIGQVEKLIDTKIGVVNGLNNVEEIENYLIKYGAIAELIEYDNEETAVNDLNTGKLDAVVTKTRNRYSYTKTIIAIGVNDYSYIVNDSNSEVLAHLNSAITYIDINYPEFKNDLIEHWFTSDDINELLLTYEEREFINNLETVKVAILSNRYVLSYYDDENEEFGGIEPNILNELSSITGIDFEMVKVPEGSTFTKAVLDGTADMALGIGIPDNKMSDLGYEYSIKIYDSPTVLAVRKGESFDLNSNNVISIPSTFPFGVKYVEENHPNWAIKDTRVLEDRLNDVLKGDADCTLISQYELQYLLQMPRNNGLIMYPTGMFDIEIGIIVSDDMDSYLLSIINKGIGVLRSNNIDRILTDSIGEKVYEQTFYDSIISHKNQYITILIVSILLIVMALLIFKQQRKNNAKLLKSNQLLLDAYDSMKKSEAKERKANRVKSDFMARMSHDMRTPMGAIMSYADFGLDEIKDEKALEYFNNIKVSSDYLLELINDVLDVQRMENDKLILNNRMLNVCKLVEEVENIIKLKALEKNIKFELINNIDNNISVNADEKRMKQVLINLLSNSIKYTDNGGSVSWSMDCQERNDKVKIICKITDTGIGMSKEFQKKMFEPFEKEITKGQESMGTGLGLSIVKKIVEAIDGSISIKSEIGKGTIVIVSAVFDKGESLPKEEDLEESSEKRLNGKKILICEDNQINSRIIEKILQESGAKTDLAINGRQGVDKAKAVRYDAIIMDIRMPVMDGLEAAKNIRKFDKDVPIVALSANAYKTDEKKSLEAGMNYHLCKPINKDELLKVLWEVINI